VAKHLTLANGFVVTALYTVITILMTWPLARHIGTAIGPDLGDPLFNSWVLLWTSGQVLAALGGNWGALSQFWNGNIFYPEASTIAFSEHLTPQMLQVLPVLAVTDNVILAYNLLLLSTFVLSGVAVYVFVRDLTDQPAAAFVAGLAFAWAPYRIGQLSHLQVLSSFWMPLALFGFRRYFDVRRWRALAGGTAALVVQGLSCGYYLLFFPPFLAAYCLYEIARRRLIGQWRIWLSLGAAATVAVLLTWPFVLPYLSLHAVADDVGPRTIEEIRLFSADAHALGTAPQFSRVWGERISAYPENEGEGFPGFTILLLAAIAIGWGLTSGARLIAGRAMPVWARVGAASAAVVGVVSATIAVAILASSGLRFDVGQTVIVYYNVLPSLTAALLAGGLVIAVLAVFRRKDGLELPWPVVFFAGAFLAATLLAFGPVITASGRTVGSGPYQWLIAYVPGFDGARVPARFLMLSSLCAAVLAGLGMGRLTAVAKPGRARAVAALAIVGILAEAWIAPLPLNQPLESGEFHPPTEVGVGVDLNPLHRIVADLPEPVVLIEFPFGEVAFDIQATFYAGYHRRGLVNGFSGYLPASFRERVGTLSNVTADPEGAATVLRASGATHALVREAAFPDGRGAAVSDWLRMTGARLMTANGPDKLFQLQ
jgi:hypothetical protein